MIPHNLPTIGIEEEDAALRVIRSKQLSQDKEVELFENEFCDYLGLPHGSAVALSNGTSSLFMALETLEAQGKKILFPGYVCAALRHAVSMAGGIENTVDVEPNSPNLDMNAIKQNLPDISIIPHMYGIPIQIEVDDTMIIEDCCQALGAKVKNKMVGLQGDVAIFSFYATKLMTSGGQGGMFVSKNQEYVDAVRDYREFDYRNDSKTRFNLCSTTHREPRNFDRGYRHSTTKCWLQRRRSSGNQSGHCLFQLRQPHCARPWLFYLRRYSWPFT